MNSDLDIVYHCTDVDPERIKREGFKSGRGGFTIFNHFQDLYNKYLPDNPMFVSSRYVKVWSKSSRFCMQIDISGMEVYPDFGHLVDYYAQMDEDNFFWTDRSVVDLEKKAGQGDKVAKRLLDYIRWQFDDQTLPIEDFTGEISFDLLGTCAIDGDKFDFSRVLDIKKKA